MLEIANVKLPLDAGIPGNEGLITREAARVLDLKVGQLSRVVLLKRSIDARKKAKVHFVATLGVELETQALEDQVISRSASLSIKKHQPYESLTVPRINEGIVAQLPRPIVIGSGPAGLFAAYYLAKAGLNPLVIERGKAIEERLVDVAAFNAGGPLNSESNIQFGEGGAGTFSDGKLSTNTKNPFNNHVLHIFVEAGAPKEILWQAKPHIGTDKLVAVVKNMRQIIQEKGGEFRFKTRLSGIHQNASELKSIELHDTETDKYETIPASQLILAIGHSARDTYEMLHDSSVVIEQKPFSVGVRVEHRQEMINEAQYGKAAAHPALGAADYKLAVHLGSGRSVYTFCMCPGGEVVCASSEEGSIVVNGMSCFARDAENANSAVLVTVEPSDFGDSHPLAGIEFQREIERKAYELTKKEGGLPYQAPVQKVGDFLKRNQGSFGESPTTQTVTSSYSRGVVASSLEQCLPGFVVEALREALPLLDRKLKGFACDEALLTGVETRSSAPLRICRDDTYQARGMTGLYPCGEGSGYAGGIMSAASDGMRVAEALVSQLRSSLA